MKSYTFKKMIFNDGFLNNSVEATYIIHLEGNGRYNDILEQLTKFHTPNIVYILFNKGYNQNVKLGISVLSNGIYVAKYIGKKKTITQIFTVIKH